MKKCISGVIFFCILIKDSNKVREFCFNVFNQNMTKKV